MTEPQTKTDLIARLAVVHRGVIDSLNAMSQAQFDNGTDAVWPPSGYLKHLILSNKPVVRALGLPKEKLEETFGLAPQASQTFGQVVEIYTARIASGVRAEDNPQVTPMVYRFPEGVEDVKTHLTEVWDTANQNLFKVLETWSDADLDRYQLPHPVLGLITVREMLFFTLHHNTVHWGDIRQGAV